MTPIIKNNNITKTYYLKFKYIFKTPEKIRQGLMYIKNALPNNEVALFMMPSSKIQSFWMKNTYIPLDMIFLSRDGVVVGYKQNTKPLDISSYYVNIPSKYVIETNRGFVKKFNINKGDIIKLPLKNQKLYF